MIGTSVMCDNRRHPNPFRCLNVLVAVAVSSLIAGDTFAAEPTPRPGFGAVQMHPGLDFKLVAQEPQVVDPVALCFDEDGRMFVVEMRDYPYGFGTGRKPGGTVRLLEDAGGDGVMDRSVVFAEGLSFATSIAPWNGGVIVAAPPEIVFLKDTDGDGRADVREVLLRGFSLGVTDSNVNGLRWGLDNLLHGVNGGNGGSVVSTRRSGPPVALRNFDFSFDPASGAFTPTYHTSGGFGLVFDDWGRSFVSYNIDHFQQRIIRARLLQRFPGLPPINATTSISDHGEMARIFPISVPETRVNHPEQSGHFSSAGGMGYVGVPGFPDDLGGSVFVCDVVGNLVHRDVLEPNGPIFAARRSRDEHAREFLASRDPAFRPVGLELGPDGALYLIDMQRDVIEHPDYIPAKVKETLDLRAGENRGRIYRIAPNGHRAASRPVLGEASAAALVPLLGHSNQWWRVTAQRLIVSRQDRSVVGAVRQLSHGGSPLARLHALWTLRGLGALTEADVMAALEHPHAGLRENALQLAETLLPGSVRFRRALHAMAGDRDVRVRFQTALTLGEIAVDPPLDVLREILLRDLKHRWSRVAVLSSLSRGEDELLGSLMSRATRLESDPRAMTDALREVADLTGARAGKDLSRVERVLRQMEGASLPEPMLIAVMDGLETGRRRSGAGAITNLAVASALERIGGSGSARLFAAAWKFSRTLGLPETDSHRAALASARSRLNDPARPIAGRLEDIELLSLGGFASVGPALAGLLEGTQPAEVQLKAVEALSRFREQALAQELVARWRSLGPAVRVPVLSLLLSRVAFHEALVSAIEQERIRVGELNLDLEQRRRLLRESSPAIRARAAKFIGDEEYSNRKTVVEEWMKKLPATGELARGREVFTTLCAQCHALDGVGQSVGPDLGALAHRSVEDLLSNILDPNMAINPAYVSYTADTADGETTTGILHGETADSVVLLQAQGRKVTLPRRSIRQLRSSGLSLMPEGVEAGMSPADLRSLIQFLQEPRRVR